MELNDHNDPSQLEQLLPNVIGNQDEDMDQPSQQPANPFAGQIDTRPFQQPAGGLRRVLQSDISSHVQGKKDLYFVLSVEGQYHLPSFDETTVHFLREVLAGRKLVFKMRDLRPVHVPRMKEFEFKVLLEMAMNNAQMRRYLPEPTAKGRATCSRRFLFNVSCTGVSQTCSR